MAVWLHVRATETTVGTRMVGAILSNVVRGSAEHLGIPFKVIPRPSASFVNRAVIARLTQDEFDLKKVSPGMGGTSQA